MDILSSGQNDDAHFAKDHFGGQAKIPMGQRVERTFCQKYKVLKGGIHQWRTATFCRTWKVGYKYVRAVEREEEKKSDMIDVDMRFLYSCNELRRNFYLDSILLDKRLE